MKKQIPIIALIICCMIWGTTFVAIKDISSKIDPYLLSILRNSIAVFILFPIILISKKGVFLKDKQSIKYGFVLGVLLGAIYVIQTFGLQFTTSNHSAFITCSAVIMVPIILLAVGKQRLTIQQILSIVIISFGLFFLTNVSDGQSYNKGDLITFSAVFICAAHIILAGHYVRKTEFTSLVFYQFLFAGIISFIGLIIDSKITGKEILFDKSAINGVIYLGLLGTLFCFFVTVWAQKYISTVFTAMIFSLEPVFASISSYIYSGELFTNLEVIGATGIFTGLIFYSIPSKKIGK